MRRISRGVLRHSVSHLARTRAAVSEVLAQRPHRYWGAEDVFRTLLASGTPISLGTIYRVLRSLTEEGVILGGWTPISGGSGKRVYRLKPASADQATRLVCRHCRQSVVLADEELRQQLIQVAQRHGVYVSDQPITIQIVCVDHATCQLTQQDAPEIPVEGLA